MEEKRKQRGSRLWFAGVSFAIGVLILLVWHVGFPGQPFDKAQWQANTDRKSGVRQRMADRLLARGTLIGLTRKEVVDMLGESASDCPFVDCDLVYLLGAERGFFRLDNEWLILSAGPDGRITKARLANY